MLVIPAGPGNTERQIELMRTFGTTCIHMTPSYALYVATIIQEKGLKPGKDIKLKRAYLGAEPYSEETRKKIEEMLKIDVFNCYGLSEMGGPGVGFECPVKRGLHIWEDAFYVEIVDPETGEPVKEGEIGELVLTTLDRTAMPIIRYRTRDLTRLIPEPCPCGRTHVRIERPLGRADDMFIVKGVNIFPQQIESVLMGIKGVAQNYQIILEGYDEMIIKVEIDRDFFDGRIERLLKLKEDITEKLRQAIQVRPKVELVEPGTLPISEGKAKRVIDKRIL
jgi:phenylacetate-CoA ligase